MRYRYLPELTSSRGRVMRMGDSVPTWAANLGYLHVEPYKAKELLDFRGYRLSASDSPLIVELGAADSLGVLRHYARKSDGTIEIKLDQPLLVDGISKAEYTNQFLFKEVPGGYQKDLSKTGAAWYAADLIYWHLEQEGYQEKLRYSLGDTDFLPASAAAASADIVVTSSTRGPLRLYEDFWCEFRTFSEVAPSGSATMQDLTWGTSRVRIYMRRLPDPDETFSVTYNRTRVESHGAQRYATTYHRSRRWHTETLNLEPALSQTSYARLASDAWNDHYAIMSGRVYTNVKSERYKANALTINQQTCQYFQVLRARKGFVSQLAAPLVQGSRQGSVVSVVWPPLDSYPRTHRFLGYQVAMSFPGSTRASLTIDTFDPSATTTHAGTVSVQVAARFARVSDGGIETYLSNSIVL